MRGTSGEGLAAFALPAGQADRQKADPLKQSSNGISCPMVCEVPCPLRSEQVLCDNAGKAHETNGGCEEPQEGNAPFPDSAVYPKRDRNQQAQNHQRDHGGSICTRSRQPVLPGHAHLEVARQFSPPKIRLKPPVNPTAFARLGGTPPPKLPPQKPRSPASSYSHSPAESDHRGAGNR